MKLKYLVTIIFNVYEHNIRNNKKYITTESRECNNVNKISIHSVLTTCN